MWLKFKYLNQISDSEQLKKATGRNGIRSYLFWKKEGGICDVRNREDIYFLLHPDGDRPSDYEVAHEKYGFTFDQNGDQINLPESTSIHSNNSTVSPTAVAEKNGETKPVEENRKDFKRGRGRPRKIW